MNKAISKALRSSPGWLDKLSSFEILAEIEILNRQRSLFSITDLALPLHFSVSSSRTLTA